ncbi:hypothetical protein HD598_001863 [Neomicrococcus aestuarii]|uniref:Uncharacterized protein n=1 Tax=Neomicrococcus aestuarii TaxID=556325 RepID=A0A7W8TUL0_9MICC|nr:hypothetical protein [Neomicrococcus aestuarii]MBB5513176.1 hypothetical protein [Neomicrococcus aestuarii]
MAAALIRLYLRLYLRVSRHQTRRDRRGVASSPPVRYLVSTYRCLVAAQHRPLAVERSESCAI